MTTFGTLSLITVSAMYVLMGTSKSRSTILQTTIPEDCIVDLDADLVGVGIRASLYVQGIVASGILLLGLVHREGMGVKEIGASLMLSQLALATSLALRMKLGTLNHLDAIFGLISLDAQLAAVSMLLSTKQVLAARWMVILVCCCHFVGFATLGVGMGRFKYVVMVANGCEDFTIGWFGYIHPLQGSPPEYWLYFTWPIISWVRNQWVCFCVMDIYDEKERVEEYSERTDTQAMPNPQSSTAHVQTSFQHRSSTIFTDFFGPFVAFWISVDALNTNIQVMGLAATSQWKTTGQFTAILLATGSVFRVLWLTWRSATNPAAFSISHMWLDCDNIPKTPIQRRVVRKEHEHGRTIKGMSRPAPGEEPAVRTIKLADDTAAKRAMQHRAKEKEAKVGVGIWMWWTDELHSDDGLVGAAAVRKHGNEWRCCHS